jgi:hypothetical protein
MIYGILCPGWEYFSMAGKPTKAMASALGKKWIKDSGESVWETIRLTPSTNRTSG